MIASRLQFQIKVGQLTLSLATYPGVRTSPPLASPITFRTSGIDACDHSECFLLSYDLHRFYKATQGRRARIWMNPAVKVAYEDKWFHWNNSVLRLPIIRWWQGMRFPRHHVVCDRLTRQVCGAIESDTGCSIGRLSTLAGGGIIVLGQDWTSPHKTGGATHSQDRWKGTGTSRPFACKFDLYTLIVVGESVTVSLKVYSETANIYLRARDQGQCACTEMQTTECMRLELSIMSMYVMTILDHSSGAVPLEVIGLLFLLVHHLDRFGVGHSGHTKQLVLWCISHWPVSPLWAETHHLFKGHTLSFGDEPANNGTDHAERSVYFGQHSFRHKCIIDLQKKKVPNPPAPMVLSMTGVALETTKLKSQLVAAAAPKQVLRNRGE